MNDMTITKQSIDAMGATAKELEAQWSAQVPNDMGMVVRLDGKRFSRWTRGFDSPFDERITHAFTEVMIDLMEEYRPDIGFTQSDEISLVWYPNEVGSPTEHPLGGKVNKLNSVLAGHCAVQFNAHFADAAFALFDCRTFAADRDGCDLVLQWRYQDAVRNGINSVASSVFSHGQLHGVPSRKRVEMLEGKGIDIGSYPERNMRGTFMRFETIFEPLPAERLALIPEAHRPTGPIERSELVKVAAGDVLPLSSGSTEKRG